MDDSYQRQFTITNAAVNAAYKRLKRFKDVPLDDVAVFDIERTLDQAAAAAADGGHMYEILDTRDADPVGQAEEHYILRLVFAEPGPNLIGVVVREQRRKAYSGARGLVLITVCTYAEAKMSIQRGQWKSVDGQPLLPPEVRVELPPVTSTQLSGAVAQDIVGLAEAAEVTEPADLAEKYKAAARADAINAREAKTAAKAKKSRARLDLPKGQRRGGTPTERADFVRNLIRQNPGIALRGPRGIHGLTKAEFGTGMREELAKKLVAEVDAEDAPSSRSAIAEARDRARAEQHAITATAGDGPSFMARQMTGPEILMVDPTYVHPIGELARTLAPSAPARPPIEELPGAVTARDAAAALLAKVTALHAAAQARVQELLTAIAG